MKRRSFDNLNAEEQKKNAGRKSNANKENQVVKIRRKWPSMEKMKDRQDKEKTKEDSYQRHQQAIQQREKGQPKVENEKKDKEVERKKEVFVQIEPENYAPPCLFEEKPSPRKRESKSMHNKAPPPPPAPKEEKKPEIVPINPERGGDQKKYPANLKKQQLNESQKIRIRNMKVTVENSDKIKEDGTIPIKLVLVGDGSVGKTSMLISYTTDNFPTDYVPTVFDNYVADVKVGAHMVKLWLWDTAGQEEYEQLRLISYQKADVFFICFSMIDANSFHNALTKWFPQVQEECPKAMKIFVGTKYDLHQQYLEDPKTKPKAIPIDYIEKKCSQKKCNFMPCSGLNQKGLNEVFSKAMSTIIERVQKRKKQSSLCQVI